MAKIEMDVSEYDEMRKRSELAEKYAESLENSKKEISDLHKKLAEQDKARIDELENSTKSVTYIRRETVTEVALVKSDKRQILDKLIRMGQATAMAATQGGRYKGHSYSDLRGHLGNQIDDDMADIFFDKTTMHSTPVLEVTERKNLDEVVSEIRLEERAQLSEDVKKKLDSLTEVSNENSQWKRDYDIVRKENKILSTKLGEIENKELENKKLNEQIYETNQRLNYIRETILNVHYFNAYFKLEKLKPIVYPIKKEDDES